MSSLALFLNFPGDENGLLSEAERKMKEKEKTEEDYEASSSI